MSGKKLRGGTNYSDEKENCAGAQTIDASQETVLENQTEKDDSLGLRRSTRTRTPNKRTQAYFKSLTASGRRTKATKDGSKNINCEFKSDESYSSNDNDQSMLEDLHKPTTLFDDGEDMAGGDMYALKTPKKRNGMATLAANTPKTPRTPQILKTPKTPTTALKSLSLCTPKSGKKTVTEEYAVKTPYHIRQRTKRDIRSRVYNEDDSDASVASDDRDGDFIANSSDDSDDSDDNTQSSNESGEEEAEKTTTKDETKSNTKRGAKVFEKTKDECAILNSARSTRSQRRRIIQNDFLPKSDDYFNLISSKKAKTSDHTLDRLKTSRLQHEDLFEILKSIKLSEEHLRKTGEMVQEYKINFSKWMLLLNKGFNIILYGLGSKRCILQQFCESELDKKPFIVINGYFPTLTVKDILHTIRTDILKVNLSGRSDHEIVDGIADAFRSAPKIHLFLIIHNLDGPLLRKTKEQHLLSRLAKIKNIHLLASIDHINAPMMWDQTCVSNFNFLWWDSTTLLPYTKETAFENSVFLQNSGELSLAAMNNVFQSLTSNARGIYRLMVDNQLKKKKDSSYQGISMRDLYHGCREKFLVSSDLALRTQLTEFVDHNMVKMKRSIDGTEYLIIPIDQYVLQQFVDQLQE